MRPFLNRLDPRVLVLALVAGIPLTSAVPPIAAQANAADTHFLIEESSACVAREGIFLNLSSAKLTPDSLELNIGFRNLRPATSPSFGILTPQDYQLVERNTRKTTTATDLSASITLVSPIGGIPPRLANAGTVTFPLPASRENLELNIAGFAPVRFSLPSSAKFTPLKLTEHPSAKPNLSLRSSHKDLSVFPLHVTAVRVEAKTISVDVAFENSSNQSVFVGSTNLSGADAFLMDGHFQIQAPRAVSPGLEHSIGPRNSSWSPGQRQSGTLTFARPQPHAMRRLLVSFPSYESLVLTFDNAARSYKAEVASTGMRSPETTSNPLRISGEVHRELSALLNELTHHVVNGDSVAYVERFVPGSPARAQQMAFLARMAQVPMSQFTFRLAGEQQLQPKDGSRIDGVTVYIDYAIKYFPAENPFRSILNCGFVRDPADGRWRIDRWSFTKQIPFWQLGFSGLMTSEHFYLFYRPGSVSEAKLAQSRSQLEQAYRNVSAFKSIQLDDKFVAFFVDQEQDFLSLTAMDPTRYHGASSTSYAVRNNRFTVLNRAMYINDFRNLHSTDLRQAEARQKTITHELIHLALGQDTRHFTPPWLVEGVAVYLAGQLDGNLHRVLLDSGGLPSMSLSALSRGKLPGSGLRAREALNLEYVYAGETVAYLLRVYGEERFFDYYRAFAAITPAELDRRAIERIGNDPSNNGAVPKVMHEITLDLTQRLFGISLYDLNSAVKSNIAIQGR